MRKQTALKIIMVLLFQTPFAWGGTLIERGKHRFIGFLELDKNSYRLILNHKTQSPLPIKLDIGEHNGLSSFVGNYIDLELSFQKACSSHKKCNAQVKKYNGVHPASLVVPLYLAKDPT